MPSVQLYGAGPPCQGVSAAGKKRGADALLQIHDVVESLNLLGVMWATWKLRKTLEPNVLRHASLT